MNLSDELVRLIASRQKIRERYLALGPLGAFGATMIQQDIDRALKAMAEGDAAAMVSACKALDEIKD